MPDTIWPLSDDVIVSLLSISYLLFFQIRTSTEVAADIYVFGRIDSTTLPSW